MPPPIRVIMPLPEQDFDPSEVAVSWQILSAADIKVVFATPDGAPARADAMMLTGEGLDLWGFIPGLRRLKGLGLLLRANAPARAAYMLLLQDAAFAQPIAYAALDARDYDALLLPGGHRARGMRAYLESPVLQNFTAAFFDAGKPVAAICHGVVLAARSISKINGKSVLHGRKTTALTWKLEGAAWRMMKFAGRFWDADYYRTYAEHPGEPAGAASVQAEVTRALRSPQDFLDVPAGSPDHFRKSSGLFRDSATDPRPAFVVQDGVYVSARWPGDVHEFARQFVSVIQATQAGVKVNARPSMQ